MEYSYKFRLYPTQVQQEQIARNFGCCRYVYNHFLAERQEQYKETGKAPTRFQQDKHLTALKQKFPWLKEVDSTSLQATLQDLDRAFQNFFHRIKQGEKARIQVARLHERIANQRKDTLHKLSTELIRQNDIICVEDLAPKNMVKNHKLAKSISDVSWGEFRKQLTYKAEWYGKKLVIIDRFYPSSQLCSICGTQWSGTKDLAVRTWTCPNCGTYHDRDHNAAKNILHEGLRLLA